MSKKLQRDARDRRDAALERERAERGRAASAPQRGDDGGADAQRKAADVDRQAATADEALQAADVAAEGERVGQPARGARRAGDGSAPSTAKLDALIDEAVEHAAAVAQAAHDAAEMELEVVDQLAALLQERARSADVDAARRRDTPASDARADVLPADVREIAALDAHAGGVTVAEYLRAAVLSYSAGWRDQGGGALEARLNAARSKAARLLAESRAVRAQSAQVTRRRASAAKRPRSGAPRRQQGADEPDSSHER